MSTFVSSLAEGPAAGIAAAVLNLIVALGLIVVSAALGVAISLLIGLPALVTQRAIRGQGSASIAE
jgi:flagellar motor component MotA